MKAEINLTVRHAAGLHARPAALFVKTAGKFQSTILVNNVTRDCKPVSAKSILAVLTQGVISGHEIHIEADGPDAQEAIAGLQQLIETNFAD